MSNYSQTTDFSAKDSLPAGDPSKIIKGSDFDTEFTAIETAVATKADTSAVAALSSVYQPLDADLTAIAGLTSAANKVPMFSGSGTATLLDLDADDTLAANSDTRIPTQQAVKAYVDTEVTAAEQGGTLTLGTAQTASGSSVDFTGIPTWVKKITVNVYGLSFAAAGTSRLRLGLSGGLVATGYQHYLGVFGTAPSLNITADTTGISTIATAAAASTITGTFSITKSGATAWSCEGQYYRATDAIWVQTVGYIADLGGDLVSLSLVATTSTFDAGTINILYE